MCADCLKPFPGKPHWSYAEVVPIRDARAMDLNDLLTKTNPILADRIHFKQKIREMDGDERFAVAFENVEGMRPGRLHSKLLESLLEWSRLNESQRDELHKHIGALFRAWQFARHMAIGFPTSSGSVTYFMSAPLFGLILIYMVVTRNWIWGLLALAISVAVASVLESILLKRTVSRWTHQVLIPEAEEANVPLERFVTVVNDIPGNKLGLTEELWPMKHQLENIRKSLIAEGKLQPAPA